jgi:hypothetical protein
MPHAHRRSARRRRPLSLLIALLAVSAITMGDVASHRVESTPTAMAPADVQPISGGSAADASRETPSPSATQSPAASGPIAAPDATTALPIPATTQGTALPTVPAARANRERKAKYFGVLQATPQSLADLESAGISTVSLQVGWNEAEPQPGQFRASYFTEMRQQIARIKSLGLDVVLDAGLEYPPQWVFSLDDSTRFTNQYGDTWHGSFGADVPDPVFDLTVRSAQANYIRALASSFDSKDIAAIRVGALYFNELHYPTASYAGHQNSYWAFSPAAIAKSPVPGYRPGQGNAADSSTFLNWYLTSLNDYGVWLANAFRSAFGSGPRLQILLPSWGIRPGEIQAAASGGLTGKSQGEAIGTINEGLDWSTLLSRLAPIGGIEAYTTWLDAADRGTDVAHISPARYLSRLAAPLLMPVGGENTGNGSPTDMARCIQAVKELGLAGMMWMDQAQLGVGANATLADYHGLLRLAY